MATQAKSHRTGGIHTKLEPSYYVKMGHQDPPQQNPGVSLGNLAQPGGFSNHTIVLFSSESLS